MWSLWKFLRPKPVSKNNRRVALTTIHNQLYVSTVRVSINRFETIIVGGPRDQETFEYATLEAAKEGHKAVVNSLKMTRLVNLIKHAGRLAIKEIDCEPN